MNKQAFSLLLDKYLAGVAIPEEEDLLANFYSSFQTTEDWDEKELGAKLQLERKMQIRLQEAILLKKRKKTANVISIFSWRAMAAAIVLVLFSTALYLRNDSVIESIINKENKVHLKTDIAPGGNKATLTLADGTIISLDEAATGEVAQELGIRIRKTTDSQLIYEITNTTNLESPTSPIAYNTISTPKGGQYQVLLPDGSKVWLNAESSLRFPTAFIGKERNAELTGEAYFEIAKNKDMPFFVKVNDAVVEVLGTHFNIRAYNDEKTSEATLLEGSVQIQQGSKQKLLFPGQKALFRVGKDEIEVVSADIDEAMAWKNGLFLFDNTSMEQAMQQIQRWYDVEVIYENDIPNIRLTGVISRNNNISKIISLLKTASGLEFSIEERKINIKRMNNLKER